MMGDTPFYDAVAEVVGQTGTVTIADVTTVVAARLGYRATPQSVGRALVQLGWERRHQSRVGGSRIVYVKERA